MEFMLHGRRPQTVPRQTQDRALPMRCPGDQLFCSPSACGSPIKGPTPCQHPATKTATAGILVYFLPVFFYVYFLHQIIYTIAVSSLL